MPLQKALPVLRRGLPQPSLARRPRPFRLPVRDGGVGDLAVLADLEDLEDLAVLGAAGPAGHPMPVAETAEAVTVEVVRAQLRLPRIGTHFSKWT